MPSNQSSQSQNSSQSTPTETDYSISYFSEISQSDTLAPEIQDEKSYKIIYKYIKKSEYINNTQLLNKTLFTDLLDYIVQLVVYLICQVLKIFFYVFCLIVVVIFLFNIMYDYIGIRGRILPLK